MLVGNARAGSASRSWLRAALGLLIVCPVVASSSAIAQSPTIRPIGTAWHPGGEFRPVPKMRSATLDPKSTAHPAQSSTPAHQRPGWNLQWRTSPTIESEQTRQISDAAFEQSEPAPEIAPAEFTQPDLAAVESASSILVPQVNHLRTHSPSTVQRVAWMTQNTGDSNSGPASGMTIPDNLFRDNAASPRRGATETVPPGRSFELPPAGAVQVLPQPTVPQSAMPPGTPNELQDLFDGPNQPPAAPVPNATEPSSGSSIRNMLEDGPATQPVPEIEEVPTQPRLNEPTDRPEMQDESLKSPSDRETFAPNPFGSRESREEEETRQQPNRFSRDRAAGDQPSIFNDADGPLNSGTGLSCDDFRDRISAATIDRVSLDISPPFRPDVIDESEYQKLKGKFDKKQESRVWRSIDGRPLGTGRLDDLAYEKAVIVTEFGSREELPLGRLSEADLAYISQNWGLPTECLIKQVAYTPRTWTPTTMTYKASNLCHKPLYFEEVNLERYGHTTGPLCQPIISSAHFFLNIAVLPYKMGVHSPHECQYALGYYRPGNCAPWIIPPVPLSVKGAWYQAAAISGTALLVP